MNFFKVMISPDREELENAERSQVADAANLLEVGEFQFLQLAYHDWYAEDLPEALIDKLFADYMLRSAVPNWARHYARKILELEEGGALDSNDPIYHRYDHAYGTGIPLRFRQFVAVATVLSGVVGGILIIAGQSTDTITVQSVLPPYFTDEELRAVTTNPEGSQPARSDMINVAPASRNGLTPEGNEVIPSDLLPRFGTQD
ncbi:MAG: hypothetical protein OQJ99_03405 [Rhodospirillales bacterium]|nr:hypothetical protein [Rhodospirillales bacterium]MCW8862608.1 hypothetical protein [Rhodospirillales bacterium]MCW8951778.1 hypothetical protein [Rhodospirillales bacterium]MCW8970486.1 hypothetical protein [Rhodospirillales bacterium]MCW9002174.1 hypothetical protein [Rhodospirillales bacterium]